MVRRDGEEMSFVRDDDDHEHCRNTIRPQARQSTRSVVSLYIIFLEAIAKSQQCLRASH